MIPLGTVILPTGEQSRFNTFHANLIRLLDRTGARIRWNAGLDIAWNINDALKRRVGEWVWIIGDDHSFEPDIIERLFAHNLDVVVPLVLQRNQPHRCVLYDVDGVPLQVEPHERGLKSVGIAGSAGMLIREHVLETIGDPWFVIGGEERQSEDIAFCRKLNAAGFGIWCDLETTMGHISNVEVWPKYDPERGWSVAYRRTAQARLA